ncbi:single-strand DNA-binding protein [Microbacterium resistens]|uniref:Single-strand DNA-binding protein n=1 Tax=Microbacterium resistens TaxID=156977 RepID=A0ABU1SFZ2_9MICO|nr:single-stranded DNA-binding protein [Microbacterium resistens]MDR6868474.1 single-strand DNA-binding protein [Microbacterium resistens]
MRQKAEMEVVGYLPRDPELRYTRETNEAVLGLSVPFTPRRKNRQSGEWEDAGATLWVKASLWGDQAELYAEKLAKGTAVRVSGVPVLRPWEANGKSGVDLELRFAEVSIIPTRPRQGADPRPAEEDAWATPGAWPEGTF